MSFVRDLYRGETKIGFVQHRKYWYTFSAVILLACILSIAIRGFNLGVDFKGGNSLQFPVGQATTSQVQSAADASGVHVETVQEVGTGSTANFVIKTGILKDTEVAKLKSTLADRLGDKIQIDGHKLAATDISQDEVSASWGSQVTRKAVIALIVFIIAVSIFISLLFEWRLSVGALAGLFHDLILSAGIYSMVGFEVTPSTVVGLLTILGYSLYDNIVVYDKVRENTRGLLAAANQTYSDAANRAVNETLARSINTSLIALFPVAGLLFVGAGLLGVGDLKDLALVLFVGLATGAYSSLFLATPIACDLKERQPEMIALRKKVAARIAAGKLAPAAAAVPSAAGEGTGRVAVLTPEPGPPEPIPSVPPRPGVRPAARNRPKKGGRPQAKRRR
jgi:preprotein translocase subunit SecF